MILHLHSTYTPTSCCPFLNKQYNIVKGYWINEQAWLWSVWRSLHGQMEGNDRCSMESLTDLLTILNLFCQLRSRKCMCGGMMLTRPLLESSLMKWPWCLNYVIQTLSRSSSSLSLLSFLSPLFSLYSLFSLLSSLSLSLSLSVRRLKLESKLTSFLLKLQWGSLHLHCLVFLGVESCGSHPSEIVPWSKPRASGANDYHRICQQGFFNGCSCR